MANRAVKKDELGEWRKAIDGLDAKIVRLLGERAECALKIGKIKSKTGAPIFDPKREAVVISRIKKFNKLLPEKSLEAIYREIFSASRAIEKPTPPKGVVSKSENKPSVAPKKGAVAYLGPAGTFSNEAALEIFGPGADLRPCPVFSAVIAEVEKGISEFGVLPIENSVGGSVDLSLDLLNLSLVKIISEKTLEVRPNLVSMAKGLKGIKRLYSHPQPLSQCRNSIAAILPGVEVIETSSTTSAAEKAAKDKNGAAICNLIAAHKYKLNVLRERIEDFTSLTRFVVVSNRETKATGRDKTSIAVTLKNKPGELYRLLGVFNKSGLNLTKIVSRPTPGSSWEYLFFIDFEGHQKDKKPASALKTIGGMGESLKILGSYPREK